MSADFRHFQALSHADFATEGTFVAAFAGALLDALDLDQVHITDEAAAKLEALTNGSPAKLYPGALFRVLRTWILASMLPVVLICSTMITRASSSRSRGPWRSLPQQKRDYAPSLWKTLRSTDPHNETQRLLISRSKFVRDGRLDMRGVLEGFRKTYTEIFGPLEEHARFSEFDGGKQFLLYLKPIINGTGNYYIEAQTRNQTRTDVIIDYAGERFVVELKV